MVSLYTQDGDCAPLSIVRACNSGVSDATNVKSGFPSHLSVSGLRAVFAESCDHAYLTQYQIIAEATYGTLPNLSYTHTIKLTHR